MQKKNCVLCISIGIIVCILLSACSRQPDFDAKSYVQSSLDAHYHGDYKRGKFQKIYVCFGAEARGRRTYWN